ncbi:MAG: SRPBCC family protein [Ignavibacteriae bacterium]|nr:SRPBCC family protein [Ignavibacteriota bacterium]
MAQHTEKTIKVNVPTSKIWKVLKDFSGAENYSVEITTSPIINNVKSGLGAKRKCSFSNGKSLVEEIIEYKEGKGYRMLLSESSMPMKYMKTAMWVKEIDSKSSEITMEAEFVMKGGPFGWIMGALMMKPMMKGLFKGVMTGLALYSENGKRLDGKLPPKEELAKILI